MDSVIKRMLVNVYELEGVILLAQERREATPETVLSIIKEKAELLLDDANALIDIEKTSETESEDNQSKEYFIEPCDSEQEFERDEISVPEVQSETDEDVCQAESDDSMQESEAVAAVASTMEKIRLFQEREQEEENLANQSEAEQKFEEPEDDVSLDVVEEKFEQVDDFYDSVIEEESICEKGDSEEILDEPSFENNEEFVDVEEACDDISEEYGEEMPEEVTSGISAEHGVANINIEDAYIRHKSKDLRSAFSINDTFRFRRELFGNSAAEMSDAINLVIAMNSYEEAEDYFYGDLKWDSESDEVKEFMEIIKNHFL